MRIGGVLGVLAALAFSSVAAAAPITRTYEFTATDFVWGDLKTPAPFPEVSGSFTVTADPDQYTFDGTSVVRNSLSAPLGTDTLFTYVLSPNSLQIGGAPGGAINIASPLSGPQPADFRLVIVDPFGTPTFESFIYVLAGNPQTYSTFTGNLQIGGTPPPGTPVPEPATLPILFVGLGLIGVRAARRASRRR